jgi:hypothetical protein
MVALKPFGASMGKVSIIGQDLAKNVIQAHGANEAGSVVFRRKVSRSKLLEFLAGFEPCWLDGALRT